MKGSGILSHIVTINVKYKNLETLKEVCEIMNLKMVYIQHKFTYGSTVEGYNIRLNNWSEPIVITTEGDIIYDNTHEVRYGSKELTKFKNTYCLVETKKQLKKNNLKYRVLPSNDEEEVIKLEVNI